MLLRWMLGSLLLMCGLTYAPAAHASQICENVLVGETPPQIVGYSGANNNQPIYGPPQPIYQEQCFWKYGALALNPSTRTYTSAWNYDDIREAENYVKNQCGYACAWVSFGENFAWIAISEDDRFTGISVKSSADAEKQCALSGGVDCVTVLAGSSSADANYWYFGAVAYDALTGAGANSWGYARRNEARAEAIKSCASPGCWAYAFQTGYGGLALADDGTLFGGWSARSEESAGKAAVKNCEKQKGKKSCSMVKTGSALGPSTFQPKPPKKKKT